MNIGKLTVTLTTKVAWWVIPAMHVMALCNHITGRPSLDQAIDIAMRGVTIKVH